jgi:hypothetical protein
LGCPSVRAAPACHSPRCGLLGLALDRLYPHRAGSRRRRPLESQTAEVPLVPAPHMDGG